MDVRKDLLEALDKPYLSVLKWIIRQMNKDTNKWYSTGSNRLEITTRLNISPSTLEKHIKTLKDKRILIHRESDTRGEYTVNSEMLTYHG